jgi:hypothetical protein
VRQAAGNILGYIERNICPAVTLERLMREGIAANPDVVMV